MITIDLNSDMGELPELLADGTQDRIMAEVSSISVSCGAHAGDDATIASTLAEAKRRGLAIGAHPGYPDSANFGRKRMQMPPAAVTASIEGQLRRLARLANAAGVELVHVKPHGALYHEISEGCDIAEAFLDAIERFNADLIIVCFAGSRGLRAAQARGFRAAAEAFMDRAYEDDGTLRSRDLPGALLPPEQALAQALHIVRHGQVITAGGNTIPLAAQTLCFHSDTAGSAMAVARAAAALRAAGVKIAPFHHS